jgi:uncharacterized membrane protein YhhN
VIQTVVIAVTVGAVGSLLVAARGGDRRLELLSKTSASAGFVCLGLLRWSAGDAVDTWLLLGLVLCAVGDLLLLHRRGLAIGMAAFMMGHLVLIAAFTRATPWKDWSMPVLVALGCASAAALRWLWSKLGRFRFPVAAYSTTISVVAWGALSASLSGSLGWTVGVGGLLFYLSDLAVARQRFVTAEFLNRGIGLPLYYTGQVLIALGI